MDIAKVRGEVHTNLQCIPSLSVPSLVGVGMSGIYLEQNRRPQKVDHGCRRVVVVVPNSKGEKYLHYTHSNF